MQVAGKDRGLGSATCHPGMDICRLCFPNGLRMLPAKKWAVCAAWPEKTYAQIPGWTAPGPPTTPAGKGTG